MYCDRRFGKRYGSALAAGLDTVVTSERLHPAAGFYTGCAGFIGSGRANAAIYGAKGKSEVITHGWTSELLLRIEAESIDSFEAYSGIHRFLS